MRCPKENSGLSKKVTFHRTNPGLTEEKSKIKINVKGRHKRIFCSVSVFLFIWEGAIWYPSGWMNGFILIFFIVLFE